MQWRHTAVIMGEKAQFRQPGQRIWSPRQLHQTTEITHGYRCYRSFRAKLDGDIEPRATRIIFLRVSAVATFLHAVIAMRRLRFRPISAPITPLHRIPGNFSSTRSDVVPVNSMGNREHSF